ncbi:Uncharacterised protein [Mycobacteroides abscessus subsp. abscessus]|uniref:Uncharacterized protein n=1 Tax=Mycobacteroides abscessus subsp. abscessus TaxID=1185650 RepID=A0AB38CZV9_9MYCO|nr:hypothetical protein [Mycobacteroides abscessus]SHW43187.1 Uncharacterised protein [Mycobacteroides abscessus subsp. abscessus]SIA24560.1 Uncharacterised protein [Mycobacteroides abscessus subsp. abscessus]SIB01316.1 Uncharacterised protein [Mycobacteroides abscessus subsp. abscessus]SIB04579.1 Uncharacterised protein [Mycobacteroides abscessus subsp. abscessus]SIB08469.1 Uncharacterised protein [Mycobacteroides abscessus subsp. abscessus]
MTTQPDTDDVRRRAYQALAPILGAVALNRTQPDYALGPAFDAVHNAIKQSEATDTVDKRLALAQHEVERRKADYEHARGLYRRAVTVRDDAAAAAEQSHNSARDERLALAQQRVYRSRARFERAKQRLDRAIRRRNQLCPAARAHKAVKNIYDAVQTLTEQPAPEPSPTLDSDPRTPADQAHEFFTRPGDFYHVALALPAPTNGAKLGAGFIVKADDTQLPYLLEVLRQLRGALGDDTRVELSKAEIGLPVGPPTVGTMPRYTEVFAPPEPSISEQITEIAEQQGVKSEQVQVIPVRGGGHAFTIKPEPQPEQGRHARPDDAWESSPKPQHLAADDDYDDEGYCAGCGVPHTNGTHSPDCEA